MDPIARTCETTPPQIVGFTPYTLADAQKYTKMRWWLGLTLGDLIDRAADCFPRKLGLIDDSSHLSYATLRQKSNKLAAGLLKLGIRKGDRVLLQLPNWGEFMWAYFACQKIGAIVVLVLHRYGRIEVDHLAKLTEAKAWIVPETFHGADYLPMIDKVRNANPNLDHVILVRAKQEGRFIDFERLLDNAEVDEEYLYAIRPDPTDVAQMLPTGGTTGLPKISPRTHNDYICSLEYKSYACRRTCEDVCLVVAPAAHGASLQIGIGSTIFSFGTIVLSASTKVDDFCQNVEAAHVTFAQLVPALLQRILDARNLERYDLGSLKTIHVGAAHSPPSLLERAIKVLGVKIISAYGSVEGVHCNTRLNDDQLATFNTVGRPCCPYDQLRVVDADGRETLPNVEGELVAKGPSVFSGYYKSDNTSNFTESGFFRTGDLAKIDGQGNVRITGRIKDVIIRGGENINPGSIERLLSQHPSVEEVAVVGMPDRDLGEKICAYIQLKGEDRPAFVDVIEFLRSQGASVLLLPERIEFVESIPLTSANKVDKKALREDIRKRLEVEEAVVSAESNPRGSN